MPRKNKRAAERVILQRQERRLTKWSKRGQPAGQESRQTVLNLSSELRVS